MTIHKLTICPECSQRHETFACRHTFQTRTASDAVAIRWEDVTCLHCLEIHLKKAGPDSPPNR